MERIQRSRGWGRERRRRGQLERLRFRLLGMDRGGLIERDWDGVRMRRKGSG